MKRTYDQLVQATNDIEAMADHSSNAPFIYGIDEAGKWIGIDGMMTLAQMEAAVALLKEQQA